MIDDARPPLPPDRHLLGRWTPWIVVLAVAAVLGALYAGFRAARRDGEPFGLGAIFRYDLSRYRTIPPEHIGYREIERIETGIEPAAALAVAPGGEIVVGGDGRVAVLTPDGARIHDLAVPEPVLALAVSAEGEVFVGLPRAVRKGPLAGPLEAWLDIPGAKARVTSIALDSKSVFVADAGARVVWHFGRDGRRRSRIGERDPDRNVPGFIVPSPYFDVQMAPDGLLRIVDPGRHQVTAFTVEGDLELAWGEASYALEGFSGCCNPSHIAFLPDGRIVTSEKGIPRVKVHDERGRFVTAVVGADGLDTEAGPCDVAVDADGRVLVLDPDRGVVRIFTPDSRSPSPPQPRSDRDD